MKTSLFGKIDRKSRFDLVLRDVDRPVGTHDDGLSNPKTEESDNKLSALGSVEVLQQELMLSEERALRAEEKVEELEGILLAIRQKETEGFYFLSDDKVTKFRKTGSRKKSRGEEKTRTRRSQESGTSETASRFDCS